MADTLSRKVELAAISSSHNNLAERIKERLPHNSKAKVLIELVKEGKTRRFWLEDELLYTKGRRLYVPLFGSLRKKIIKECHDSKWAGHPGVRRTIALVEETYYWPHIEEDIEAYVKTCLVY